jgi:hypothetical protein
MMSSRSNSRMASRGIAGSLTLVALCTSACRHSFKPEDLVAYNSYSSGDTIIFHSTSNHQDTFAITSKRIINKGWDENTGWYNPPVAYVTYIDLPDGKCRYPLTSGGVTRMADGDFMTIWKTRPSDQPDEILGFLGFLGTIDRTSPIIPADSVYPGPVYKVPRFDLTTARDSTDLTYVYWSDLSGIVGYDYKSGEHWKLVRRTHLTSIAE